MVCLCCVRTQGIAVFCGGCIMCPVGRFYSTADYSTTTWQISILFSGNCRTRCQLSNSIRYVSVASELRKSLSSVEGVSSAFLPTANSSTTTRRIVILFEGDCWTQCQLSNAVRYISVISKLRKSHSSVEGISGGILLDSRLLYNS